MTEEYNLTGEIWDNEHWASDYLLDIDIGGDSREFYTLIESNYKVKVEIKIKIIK